MNQKIINRICCIALIGWFLWAMQLFCADYEGEDGMMSTQADNTDAGQVYRAGELTEGNRPETGSRTGEGNGAQTKELVVVIAAAAAGKTRVRALGGNNPAPTWPQTGTRRFFRYAAHCRPKNQNLLLRR